ncbi:MAG: cytochrome C oxidase subunit IV family protein [Planctomycetes bacterium]|nr:cytochrome C oxidase subunit IV family protein [Planctomycetota bacterium]MCB9884425.1 cytochrome C oxidase subunit IV family protein [Planctomycetota bacterium]
MSASNDNAGHGHTASGHDAHGHGELQMGHHHVSSSAMFLNVLIALLILTAITVGASRIDFGSANLLIAMAIASVKASLVIAFFMHVKWDTAINKIVFLSSFLFLSLLFIFTLADQATRRMDDQALTTKTPVDKQWVHPSTLAEQKQ